MAIISLIEQLLRPTAWGLCKLQALFGEWWRRITSRYELESLSELDLADMGMTAFNEIQKPF
jgi:uncharacterized protein YjiS (DUF1127 family)